MKKIKYIVLTLFTVLVLTGCTKTKIEFNPDLYDIVLEYSGEVQTINVTDWISNLDKLDIDRIIEKSVVTMVDSDEVITTVVKTSENELGLELTEVGIYNVKISDGNSEVSNMLVIQDTMAPVLDIQTTYETTVGNEVDFKYDATDLSSFEVEIDHSGVDFEKPGEYKVTYVATDSHGNKTEASSVVTVKEKSLTDYSIDEVYQRVIAVVLNYSKGDKISGIEGEEPRIYRNNANGRAMLVSKGNFEEGKYSGMGCYSFACSGTRMLEITVDSKGNLLGVYGAEEQFRCNIFDSKYDGVVNDVKLNKNPN